MRLLALALALLPSVAAAQAPWTLRAPSEARQTGVFAGRIDESSGLAASRQHAGVLWTLEDSGNPATLHAVDTSGTILGTWRIEGARNADWEAIALGPCGSDSCLYIADTGDNGARRSTVTIYRVREPSMLPNRRRGRTPDARISRPDALTLRYPDGAHDVEALVVTPREDLILISKGRREAVRAYRLDRSAWSADQTVTAHPLGTLPMPTEGIAGLVTDAALHPDGRRLVVRTYAALHFFTFDADAAPAAGARPEGCAILGLELQGEGVTWLDEATLALSSEAAHGMPGTISLVRCPRS